MQFKNKKVIALAAMAMGFLGIKEIPIVEGKVHFDEGQENKLKAELSQHDLDALIKAFNEELEANEDVKEIKAEIKQMLLDAGLSEGEVATMVAEASEGGKPLSTEIKAIKAVLDKKDRKIQALIAAPEEDTPLAQIKGAINTKLKHSATHLFASNKEWDAFAGRPWNARAAGHSISAADYNEEFTIQKLNGDVGLYFRENPDELKSLHRDNFGLPSFWPKRLKVDSTVTSGSILTAEITQGRKFGWLPKNKQIIEPEEGKIYPVQIDAEWDGYKLQEIEDSWLNFMNKEGSSPEKMSFVRFLVQELMKQARVEDRISTVNGIYVKTPDDATVGGKMINRQNGLFYQLWKARDIFKKYRPFQTIGAPTTANIYDYLHDEDKGLVTQLPFDVKYSPGLKLYMSKKYWDAYKAKYKEINGQNMDYKGLPEYPENYPNIEVVNLVDHNSAFMFMTFGDNIEILENIPAEKSAYKFQWILRKLHLMADYKLGVRLIHIGRPVSAGDPDQFKVQSVWSNTEPIFSNDIFAPVFDNKTGKLEVNYKNIHVADNWGTDITSLGGVTEGQIIKIKGNASMPAGKAVKSNSVFQLTGGDFPLQSGGVLTLYINESLKAQEISRTTAPDATPVADVEFNDAVIDANEGYIFRYTGSADKTITGIVGGFDGQKVVIYGNDVTDVDVTIATVAGSIAVGGTAAVLSDDAHYLELVKVDGVWTKVKLVNS